MLEKYKYEQPVLYNVLINAIMNNKLSHAYLIDSNGNSEVNNIILSFVKMIITYDITNEEEKKIICERIDDGNYIDVKIIEPDGMWIKKEQLADLQSEFSKKAIEGKRKVYIIKSAEKMNVQTANSILKFLEEPVDDIIAIMIVNNINLMLPTIISRCQNIKLNKQKLFSNSLANFNALFSQEKYFEFADEEKRKLIDDVISFILFLERNGLDTIIYAKKVWHTNFSDRNLAVIAVNLCLYFYNDVIKYKSNLDSFFYWDKLTDISVVASLNEYDDLIKKIGILDEIERGLKRNLNINLLIDRMIIDMCGDVNESC